MKTSAQIKLLMGPRRRMSQHPAAPGACRTAVRPARLLREEGIIFMVCLGHIFHSKRGMNKLSTKSGRRRHRSLRAVWSRIALLLAVVGSLCLVVGLLVLGISLLAPPKVQDNQRLMAAAYVASGIVLLAVRFALRRRSGGPARATSRHSTTGRVPPASPKRSGAVLVLTLIVIALLSSLLVQVQFASRSALREAEAEFETARLRLAARNAVFRGISRLASDPDPDSDHDGERWAEPLDETTPTGISTRVVVTDEQRYFDLNNLLFTNTAEHTRSSADIVMDLMTLSGDYTPIDRVSALQDWIDADDRGLHESFFYRRKTPPYRPPNRLLLTWRELIWVEGFTRAYFEPRPRTGPLAPFQYDFADCVTVLPVMGERPLPVNVNQASRVVLEGVFGLAHEDEVEQIVGTRQLEPFASMDDLIPLLDPELFERIRTYLDVKSSVFRVEARAYKNDLSQNLRALVERAGDHEVKVLGWIY